MKRAEYCVACRGRLGRYGTKSRVCIDEYGEKYQIKLQRYKCSQCGELYLERPDCFRGRKQYLKEIVETIQGGSEMPKNTGPSRVTAYRWRKQAEIL